MFYETQSNFLICGSLDIDSLTKNQSIVKLIKKNWLKMKFVNKNGRVYPKKFHRVSEVLSRFQPDDFWIRLNRRVFNLTSLTKQIDEPDYIQIEDYYVSCLSV